MADNAVAAFGLQLQLGDGATPTEVFTTIADVRDVDGPDSSTRTKDTTTHSKTSKFSRFIGTILEAGTVDFQVNFSFLEATHQDAAGGLYDNWKNLTKSNWRIVGNETGDPRFDFNAMIVKYKTSFNVEDEMLADVSLKIDGAITMELP